MCIPMSVAETSSVYVLLPDPSSPTLPLAHSPTSHSSLRSLSTRPTRSIRTRPGPHVHLRRCGGLKKKGPMSRCRGC